MVLVHALKSFHICNSTKSTKSEGRRCYAIPTRGAIHGPVGGIPHVPQPGSRGFSAAGRGNAGHLPHQQQQPIGAGMGSGFNFPSMETPNSQPSPGGPLSQPGFVSNMTQGASQTYRDGFSVGGMSQDFLGDDFKSQGSHVQYNVGDLSTQFSIIIGSY
ncbi:RNA helicase [Artemisia annua]|uniref:RNA helicase n=1 Tax=Artemisia annua TaxID=35608 RepID=A0A2U1Q5N3_ARTAN|nr:RNA helicase [Artemisia annua]